MSGVGALLGGRVQCINSALQSAEEGTGPLTDVFHTGSLIGRHMGHEVVVVLLVGPESTALTHHLLQEGETT